MLHNTTLTRLYNTLGRTPDEEMLKRVIKKQMRRNQLLNSSSFLDTSSRQLPSSSSTTISSSAQYLEPINRHKITSKKQLKDVIESIPNAALKQYLLTSLNNNTLKLSVGITPQTNEDDITVSASGIVTDKMIENDGTLTKDEQIRILNDVKNNFEASHNFWKQLQKKIQLSVKLWSKVDSFQSFSEAVKGYFRGDVLMLPNNDAGVSFLKYLGNDNLKYLKGIVERGFIINQTANMNIFGSLSHSNGEQNIQFHLPELLGFMDKVTFRRFSSYIKHKNDVDKSKSILFLAYELGESHATIHNENDINWTKYKKRNNALFNVDNKFVSSLKYNVYNSNSSPTELKEYATANTTTVQSELNRMELSKNDIIGEISMNQNINDWTTKALYSNFIGIYSIKVTTLDFDYVDFLKDIYDIMKDIKK